jgi:hypothetical protein
MMEITPANVAFVDMMNQLHVGRTILRAELREGQYMRWHFDDGSFQEWYIGMWHGSSHGSSVPLTEGRLFKEDEHVTA